MRKLIFIMVLLLIPISSFAGIHYWKTDATEPEKLLEELYPKENNLTISTDYFVVGYKLKLPFNKVLTMTNKEEHVIGDDIYWFSYQTKDGSVLKIPIRAKNASDTAVHVMLSPGYAYKGCYTFVQHVTAFMLDNYYVKCEYVYVQARYGYWTTRFYVEELKE